MGEELMPLRRRRFSRITMYCRHLRCDRMSACYSQTLSQQERLSDLVWSDAVRRSIVVLLFLSSVHGTRQSVMMLVLDYPLLAESDLKALFFVLGGVVWGMSRAVADLNESVLRQIVFQGDKSG